MKYEILNSMMKFKELENLLRLGRSKDFGKKESQQQSYRPQCCLSVKTLQEVEGQFKEEYSKKLELEYCTLPDPFKLETSLMGEKMELRTGQLHVSCTF